MPAISPQHAPLRPPASEGYDLRKPGVRRALARDLPALPPELAMRADTLTLVLAASVLTDAQDREGSRS